jgi:hypothetical protein
MARQGEKSQGREEPGRTSASMLPKRHERPALESAFVRVIATSGVVGIGVALGAILTSQMKGSGVRVPASAYRLGQGTVGSTVTVSPLRNVISTWPLKPPFGHVFGTVP